ncbi:MAG: hypothetical protein V2A66_01525 [Pseudomonadota bacterium]
MGHKMPRMQQENSSHVGASYYNPAARPCHPRYFFQDERRLRQMFEDGETACRVKGAVGKWKMESVGYESRQPLPCPGKTIDADRLQTPPAKLSHHDTIAAADIEDKRTRATQMVAVF